jgi:hypothetical protein
VIARFEASVKDDEAAATAKRQGANLVRKIPYVPNGWLLETAASAGFGVLDLCDRLVRSGRVLYAEPNAAAGDPQINPTDRLAPDSGTSVS